MTTITIEKYQPSSGTEGQAFFDEWCCRCSRDKAMREGADFDECDDNELCPIIADTMRLRVDDQAYPEEWRYDASGNPVCTAFVEHPKAVPYPRCTKTMDLFTEK